MSLTRRLQCVEYISTTPPHIATATPFSTMSSMKTYDILPAPTVSAATLWKTTKEAGKNIKDIKDADMEKVNAFAVHLKNHRAHQLPADKFEQFCKEEELGNNLEMWIVEEKDMDQMLAAFDEEFEKFTPVAQPMYGSSGTPSILKPGLGREDTANETPTPASTVTLGDSSAGGTPSGATPSRVTPPSVTPDGSTAKGGDTVGSGSDKDPTKTLASKIKKGQGLSNSTAKLMIDKDHPAYAAIMDVQTIDRRLHENGNPPEGNVVTNPELVKLGQQVANAQALVDAPQRHLKEMEAKLRAMDAKITTNQAKSQAGRARMAKHQEAIEEIRSQLLVESTKVEAIDKLLSSDNNEKGVLETAVGEAKAAVEGEAHKKSVAELKTLQGDYEALANQGKLTEGDIKAMKERRKQHFEVIDAEAEGLKTVVVERHTQTDRKDVRVLFCGPKLSTVEYKVSKAGEKTITTVANPTTGNNNCGTRDMFESLPVVKINLAAKKTDKSVGKSPAGVAGGDVDMAENVEQQEDEMHEEKQGEVKKRKAGEGGQATPDESPIKAAKTGGKPRTNGRTRETPQLPNGDTTRNPRNGGK